MSLNIGDVIYLKTPNSPKPHYTIVVGIGENERDIFLVHVCITSIKEGLKYDNSCVLNNSDYIHLKNPSWVYYKETMTTTQNQIDVLIKNGFCKVKEPLSRDVLFKVMEGGKKSKRTKKGLKRFYELFFS